MAGIERGEGAVGWGGSARILAVVRFREGGDLDGVLEALRAGGIEIAEITLDTPDALGAIERASRVGAAVGAGTVLTEEDVVRAAEAGAAFVVSPGLFPDVVGAARDRRLEVIPGALTATEVGRAAELGATAVKLFPASLGGPAYVRALRGPFPHTPLVPTGGIGIRDVAAFLAAGADRVGLGGELIGREAPRDDAGLAAIAERAAVAVAAAATAGE